MDRIVIAGIEVFAHGGVTEAERQIGQHYRIDLALERDLYAAGLSDSLSDTVSYAAAHDIAVAVARERPFALVESLAERIAARLLTDLDVIRVQVGVHKLQPPMDGVVASAGVEIVRERAHPERMG